VGRGEGVVEGIIVVEAKVVDDGSIIASILDFEVSDAPIYLEVFVRIPLSDDATAPTDVGPVIRDGAANEAPTRGVEGLEGQGICGGQSYCKRLILVD